MKHPILWIRYKLRKPRWYLRKEVLLHRYYLGAWPDPVEVKDGYTLKYGHLHSIFLQDELSFVTPAVAKFIYNRTIDERQIHD